MTATQRKPRVWFGKALPGQNELSRWIVNWGPTKNGALPVGYVAAYRGRTRQSGAYWHGYALYGGLRLTPPSGVHSRREAADAVALHAQQHPPPS